MTAVMPMWRSKSSRLTLQLTSAVNNFRSHRHRPVKMYRPKIVRHSYYFKENSDESSVGMCESIEESLKS